MTDIKQIFQNKHYLLFSALIGIAILYLGSIWKISNDIDRFTTDVLFWGAILWSLWQKKGCLRYRSGIFSSFLGWMLLSLVLTKAITLRDFESIFISFLPVFSLISLALITSGFKGLKQYLREFFFAWFLFFPIGAIGHFLDNNFYITIINAKIATYFLYYLGFDTFSYGNEVILNLPDLGTFKAIVGLPCAGIPMILLILKLALLLISGISLKKQYQILLPSFSLVLGFMLGVIRVCLLTLLIPNPSQFDYWHGNQGSQIFSTIAIIIFSGFCYWILEKNQQSIVTNH